MNTPVPPRGEAVTDRIILLVSQIAFTSILVGVLFAVITATTHAGTTDMSSFEQNVLSSMVTATVLNMKEVINATVALASGKNVAQLGTQLANATPTVPLDADGSPAPTKVEVTNTTETPVPVTSPSEGTVS